MLAKCNWFTSNVSTLSCASWYEDGDDDNSNDKDAGDENGDDDDDGDGDDDVEDDNNGFDWTKY